MKTRLKNNFEIVFHSNDLCQLALSFVFEDLIICNVKFITSIHGLFTSALFYLTLFVSRTDLTFNREKNYTYINDDLSYFG